MPNNAATPRAWHYVSHRCDGSPFAPRQKVTQDECHPKQWVDPVTLDSTLAAYQAACKAAREAGNAGP